MEMDARLGILAIFLIVLTAGCSTTQTMNGIMSSWVDSDVGEVVAQWGKPDEMRESNGNKIYVWNHPVAATTPEITVRTLGISSRIGSTGSTTMGGGPKYDNCQRRLEVNAQGQVVNWQWNGDHCPSREEGPYANWRRKKTGQ